VQSRIARQLGCIREDAMNTLLWVVVGLLISAGGIGLLFAVLLAMNTNESGAVVAFIIGAAGVVSLFTGLIGAFILHRK